MSQAFSSKETYPYSVSTLAASLLGRERIGLLGVVVASILGGGCGLDVAPTTGSAGKGSKGSHVDAGAAAHVAPVAHQPQTAHAKAAPNAPTMMDRSSGAAGGAGAAPSGDVTGSAGTAASQSSQAGQAAAAVAGDDADAGTAASPAAGAASTSREPDHEKQWVEDHGFGSVLFAVTCVSRAPDGSLVEGEPLPVGDGYQLECRTASSASEVTTEFLDDSNERWCALGTLSQAFGESSHPCLKHVEITNSPDDGPWTLVASGDEMCRISRVASSFGKTWPLWVNASYDTAKISPARKGSTCDELFGR